MSKRRTFFQSSKFEVKVLEILSCSDKSLWYAKHVGWVVPYEGQSATEWRSREPGGYVNFVKLGDARVKTMTLDSSLRSYYPWPLDGLGVRENLRRQLESAKQNAPCVPATATASQSRAASSAEALANTVIGFAISLGITAALFPHLSLAQNIGITAIFTAASLLRSYALRRLFNRWTTA